LYEFLGKIRNAALGQTENLPALAVEMAKYGEYIILILRLSRFWRDSSTDFADYTSAKSV